MKKFLRAFGAIAINVVALPLDVMSIIVGLALALYFEITLKMGKDYLKACCDRTYYYTKELINWVKTGKLN